MNILDIIQRYFINIIVYIIISCKDYENTKIADVNDI